MSRMNYQSKSVKSLVDGNYSESVIKDALLLKNDEQEELFSFARDCRFRYFPKNNLQVRSVIETSNICRQGCRYCAIGGKSQTHNYSLNHHVTAGLIESLYHRGRRVILLQSGENANSHFINEMEKAIGISKERYPDLIIILCMGNLAKDQYVQLRRSGADAYILKFETSNPDLFSYCRPRDSFSNRLNQIETLINLGYDVGSGNIVGLPHQTIDDLYKDLILIHKLPLSMNSTTIFCPAERSEFENEKYGDPDLTLNFMAIMRIMNPQRLMPTTSSLKKIIPDGQYKGLMAGANTITVHDGTPAEYQDYFPIYSVHRTRPQVSDFNDIIARTGMITDHPL